MVKQNSINNNADHLDLDPITAPVHKAGRIFFDTDTDTLNVYNSNPNLSLQVGEELWVKVKNESGSQLHKWSRPD